MSLVEWMKFSDSVWSGELVAVFAANWPATGGCAINVTVTYSVFAPILWRTGDRSDNREAVE
jgi:hypothetical protein